MDPILNPYSPGAGLRPPALVGRDAEMRAAAGLAERVRLGLAIRGIVLTGLRGVGKTVLLQQLRSQLRTAGWFELALEARPDDSRVQAFRHRLARELGSMARRSLRDKATERAKTALGSLSAFGVQIAGTGVSFQRQAGRADSGRFEADVTDLIEDVSAAAGEAGVGLVMCIDEMQDAPAEVLASLLAAQHRAGQEGWPYAIIGAGLPSLPRALSEARSYAERLFEYRVIGPLSPPDAAAALLEPARMLGGDFTDAALNLLLEASAGYPYFLQEYGHATWNEAVENPFTASDAELGIDRGRARLDGGFYRSRWDRATKAERQFLRAMTPDGGAPSSTSSVAERMAKSASGIGPARAALISKGLIYAPEHGQVAYTVPGMAEYIQRQHE